MTEYASLKSVFDTLGVNYTEATFNSDYYKKLLQLGTVAQFIFDDKGNYVEYKDRD